MPRQKRKGATAEIAESGFNKNEDGLSSIGEDLYHKGSIVIEQMQLVKKGKNDHTDKQKKMYHLQHVTMIPNQFALKKMATKVIYLTKLSQIINIKKMVERNCKRHVMM